MAACLESGHLGLINARIGHRRLQWLAWSRHWRRSPPEKPQSVLLPKYIFSRGTERDSGTGLVQQTVQIVASHDLTLFVRQQMSIPWTLAITLRAVAPTDHVAFRWILRAVHFTVPFTTFWFLCAKLCGRHADTHLPFTYWPIIFISRALFGYVAVLDGHARFCSSSVECKHASHHNKEHY